LEEANDASARGLRVSASSRSCCRPAFLSPKADRLEGRVAARADFRASNVLPVCRGAVSRGCGHKVHAYVNAAGNILERRVSRRSRAPAALPWTSFRVCFSSTRGRASWITWSARGGRWIAGCGFSAGGVFAPPPWTLAPVGGGTLPLRGAEASHAPPAQGRIRHVMVIRDGLHWYAIIAVGLRKRRRRDAVPDKVRAGERFSRSESTAMSASRSRSRRRLPNRRGAAAASRSGIRHPRAGWRVLVEPWCIDLLRPDLVVAVTA
jgi:hypothetical protein